VVIGRSERADGIAAARGKCGVLLCGGESECCLMLPDSVLVL
jgi:hypothetical protein